MYHKSGIHPQLYITRVKAGHSPAKRGAFLRKDAGNTIMGKMMNEEIRRQVNMQPAEQT